MLYITGPRRAPITSHKDTRVFGSMEGSRFTFFVGESTIRDVLEKIKTDAGLTSGAAGSGISPV